MVFFKAFGDMDVDVERAGTHLQPALKNIFGEYINFYRVNMNKNPGTLYYLMGASGSGKDSILRHFRQYHNQSCGRPIVIAHRYITRDSDATENAISVSPIEYELRKKHQFFALTWEAHDLSYGIGIEINHWLKQGVCVLVNGSRAYLPEARDIYQEQLHSILVSVDDNLLKERLTTRNRESDELVAERLQRHQYLKNCTDADSELINNESLDLAAQKLARIIREEQR